MTTGKLTVWALLAVLIGACTWGYKYHMALPGIAHHKIIVSTDKRHDGDRSVVLVLHQDGNGALGLLLNGPAPAPREPHLGGPVKTDVYYTLHSLDLTGKDTIGMPDIGVGYTPGDFLPIIIKKMGDRPFEYLFFKGYTVWSKDQLDKEIEEGSWKIINFDKNLIFHTAPEQLWDVASKKPPAPKPLQ